MEQLGKVLVNAGRWSRREMRELVRVGRVAMDGVMIQAADGKYDPAACFKVDDETVSRERLVYLMLHKLTGLISVVEDPHQPTALELLPQHLHRMELFPAGQLGRDTEGLFLLTNDSPPAHCLLALRHRVDKIHFVRVDGELDGANAVAFAAGMILENGLACPSTGLEVLKQPDTALIILHEGKYHQIKHMLAARGKPVVYLKRLTTGPLVLNPVLERGEWRPLSAEEAAALWQVQRRPGQGAFTVNLPDTAGHTSASAQRYDLVYALSPSPSPWPLCSLSVFGSFDKKFCKTY